MQVPSQVMRGTKAYESKVHFQSFPTTIKPSFQIGFLYLQLVEYAICLDNRVAEYLMFLALLG